MVPQSVCVEALKPSPFFWKRFPETFVEAIELCLTVGDDYDDVQTILAQD